MNWIEIFPIVALILFITGDSLQLRKTWKEKSSKELSLIRYVIGMVINTLFAVYYYILGHMVTLILNEMMGVLMMVILILGYKYRRREKDGPNRKHS